MNNPTRTETSSRDTAHAFASFPLADADACVKCGLCLPHCPTYALTRHEGDSPRGRIALMQGLAQQALQPEGNVLPHLDGCLACRACERVCPAQVPYGRLIDAGRVGLWQSGHRPGLLWKMLAFFRRTPARLQAMTRALRALRFSKFDRLLARLPLGRLARITSLMRETARPVKPGRYPTTQELVRGKVGLFLGCVARPLDAKVAQASIAVLNAMGYEVLVPAEQVCCGAMDTHAGDATTAASLAAANIQAFVPLDAVISTASGCGAELQEYSRHDLAQSDAFSRSITDIMSFIVERLDQLPPLVNQNARVLTHVPCTLRNAMRAKPDAALTALRRIPDLDVSTVGYSHCCGAAGSYLFEQPQTADALGTRWLDAVADDPDFLATSNIGCSLHLARLARRRGQHMQLCHPVELLAASLPDKRV